MNSLLIFNLGAGEIILIALVVLLLFGGKKIPELMRGLGKGVRSFKNGMNEIEDTFERYTKRGFFEIDMKYIKAIFTHARTLVWFIVSVVLIAILITAAVLSETVLFEVFRMALGSRKTETFGGGQFYVSDYEDKEDALEKGDYETVGKRMYETHWGMSKDYEVSCEELDFLAEIAEECGVTGSRIMGGGFGGCTINLVKDELYDRFIATAREKFNAKYGHEPQVYDVVISDGSRRLE